MNSAKEVDSLIQQMKADGIPLSDAAWEAAKACIGWPYIFGDRGEYDTPERRKAVYEKHGGDGLISKCQVLNGKAGSCDGCKWYPGGCRVRSYDCRGFTYWILLQIYGWKLMGAGCTSQWDTESNWKAKGEVKDGIPQGVIVCLFYYKKDSSGKRTKTLEHTGLYYNGETIECSNGVQYSRNLNPKWEVWGIPACVDGAAPDPQPDQDQDPDGRPTLRRGSKGEYVQLLQAKLLQLGYSLPRYGADGSYGSETINAVINFQRDNGLDGDGVCGQKTWEALDRSEPMKLYTVYIPHLPLYKAEAFVAAYGGAYMSEEEGGGI